MGISIRHLVLGMVGVLLSLLWLHGGAASVLAAAPATDQVSVGTLAGGLFPPMVQANLFANWLDSVMHFFERTMNSQQRMLQFGVVGMLLALWVIWWRK